MCTKCGDWLTEENWQPSWRNKWLAGGGGYNFKCRKCVSSYVLSMPRASRAWKGVTEKDYNSRLNSQGGVCMLSDVTSCAGREGERLLSDHDHRTGQLRGILCRRHNTLVAACGESFDIASKVVTYLAKYQNPYPFC